MMHDSSGGKSVKYVNGNSMETLKIFTHGPGHCLNTPAIQLEILNLWESRQVDTRRSFNCVCVPAPVSLFFENTRISK